MKKYFFLILISWISFTTLNAQWEPCSKGLPVCEAACLLVDGNNTYCGIDCGIYLSTDYGVTWVSQNKSLLDSDITSMAISGNYFFVGTDLGGIFLSTNKGENWIEKNNGLLSLDLKWVRSIVINGNNIFAGTNKGIFLSTNHGDDWISKNNGLTDLDTIVFSMLISGNNVYAGTAGGIFMSTDNGNNWIAKNKGLTNLSIQSLAINGNKIFTGTGSGIFMSTDFGDNWTEKDSGIPKLDFEAFAFRGNNIFAGSFDGGIYLSTDNGDSWTAYNSGLSCTENICIAINGNYIFTGAVFCLYFRANLSDFGINVDLPPKEFIIYPNPANNELTIHNDFEGIQDIIIWNILGQNVYQSELIGNVVKIDISVFANGYYFIRVNGRTQMFVKI
ncbi:MAG: T9SS type A sorting domain-containing protein [FCB group bacterium]